MQNVAIYLRTRDRSDFVIRQLQYYASVNCPHPIYIGDASNEEHSARIKNAIKSLENKIAVTYKLYQETEKFTQEDSHDDLLSIIKEKYGACVGDDDYFVPNSLTKCAQFLEEHPDYVTASGYAVSFRLKNNGIYGELNYIADYPRKQVEHERASERAIKFFQEYYTPMFYVHRMDSMRKFWRASKTIPDVPFATEILPSVLLVVEGKSKVVDCLSLVRQIHNRHYALPGFIDRITGSDWGKSYKMFEDAMAKNISEKDNITREEAILITRQAFLTYLKKYITKECGEYDQGPKSNYINKNIMKPLRSKITRTFPFLKHIYRTQVKPRLTGKKELHYEVLKAGSKYHKDFKPIMDSFTGFIK